MGITLVKCLQQDQYQVSCSGNLKCPTYILQFIILNVATGNHITNKPNQMILTYIVLYRNTEEIKSLKMYFDLLNSNNSFSV